MIHIDRCEIFIATFIATFIAPFDGNRLKPNTGQGLSPFTTPIDFSVCYENCESIAMIYESGNISGATGFLFFRWQSYKPQRLRQSRHEIR